MCYLVFLLAFPNYWLLFCLLIVFVQAMNLGLGKLTQNVCVFYTHSKTTLIIYNAPSAFVFDGSIISSLGTSYF